MEIKKVLISQPKPANDKSPYYEIGQKHNIEMVFRPFIKVEGMSARDFRQQKVNIADFNAIIFTAKTAVDHFFRLCEEMRISIPATMKYFCTHENIANYLQKYIVYRKRKIFASATGTLEGLVPALQKLKGEPVLFALSDVHTGAEVAYLQSNKINVVPAVMYRTVSNDFGPDEAFDYDVLIFFSPQGIESLLKNFPDFKQGDIVIAAFGDATVQSVKDAGLRVDIAAPTPEAPSMTTALDNYLSAR